jgi:hypothetical protein
MEGTFEDLEPAHLNDRICDIGVVRVAGQKPGLDALYDGVAKDSCSGSVGDRRVQQ